MTDSTDTNAAIWKSDAVIKEWAAKANERERARIGHWRTMAKLLPFEESDEFTFLDLAFDMLAGAWPDAIPTDLGAVITSLCIHHMPNDRKRGLFVEIFEHLVPGGWYFNYDPVTSPDPLVEGTWQHTNDREDSEAEHKRTHRTGQEQARYENHVRYMIPLDQQLGYFRAAGFEGIDVYWKHLENVIYGGRRPN